MDDFVDGRFDENGRVKDDDIVDAFGKKLFHSFQFGFDFRRDVHRVRAGGEVDHRSGRGTPVILNG